MKVHWFSPLTSAKQLRMFYRSAALVQADLSNQTRDCGFHPPGANNVAHFQSSNQHDGGIVMVPSTFVNILT